MTILKPRDPVKKADVALTLPQLPRDDEGPVFAEPWQASAVALAVSLSERGHFTWTEWAETLGAALRESAARGWFGRHHDECDRLAGSTPRAFNSHSMGWAIFINRDIGRPSRKCEQGSLATANSRESVDRRGMPACGPIAVGRLTAPPAYSRR